MIDAPRVATCEVVAGAKEEDERRALLRPSICSPDPHRIAAATGRTDGAFASRVSAFAR
jgi:hypothetical protein